MASNKYYSTYDIGKIRDKIMDIRDDINRICERAMDGFQDSVWATYKRRCAELDAEKALRTAMNTHSMEPCPVLDDELIISAELTCPISGENVIPKDEVVVAVDDDPMDEKDIGSEFQRDKPVDAILVNIGNEETHVTSNEPPLHCVVPAFSLQVHAPSIDDIDNMSTLAASLMQLKDIQADHIYHDPFLVFCTPFDFIVADWFVVHIRLALRKMAMWFTSLLFKAVRHSECLVTYVLPRLLFDPGGFEDESFSNREGMM